MSYTKTTWADGDTITAAKLNNIENGIVDVGDDVASIDVSGGNFYVTFDYDSEEEAYTADKSAKEIYEAYEDGKYIVGFYDGSFYNIGSVNKYENDGDWEALFFSVRTYGREGEVTIYSQTFTLTQTTEASPTTIIYSEVDDDVVSTSREINDIALTSDITITGEDIADLNAVQNYSDDYIYSYILPTTHEGFGKIAYRDQSFNENHEANIEYGVIRSSGTSSSFVSVGADNISLHGRINANNNKIINIDTPIANTDAATKGYVDTAITNANNLFVIHYSPSAPSTSGRVESLADILEAYEGGATLVATFDSGWENGKLLQYAPVIIQLNEGEIEFLSTKLLYYDDYRIALCLFEIVEQPLSERCDVTELRTTMTSA